MLEHYPLRKSWTGFRKWCRVYLERSRFNIKIYESVMEKSEAYLFTAEMEYKEAKIIQNQYQSLMYSLNEIETKIFKEEFEKGKLFAPSPYSSDGIYKKEIYNKWCMICFSESNEKKRKAKNEAESYGKLLIELRKRKNLSLKEVAELALVNVNTLRLVERGVRHIRADLLAKLLIIYGVSANEFFDCGNLMKTKK